MQSTVCVAVACQSHQYRCTNGRCIYQDWMCDGVEDCPLGDDELPSLCSKYFVQTKLEVNFGTDSSVLHWNSSIAFFLKWLISWLFCAFRHRVIWLWGQLVIGDQINLVTSDQIHLMTNSFGYRWPKGQRINCLPKWPSPLVIGDQMVSGSIGHRWKIIKCISTMSIKYAFCYQFFKWTISFLLPRTNSAENICQPRSFCCSTIIRNSHSATKIRDELQKSAPHIGRCHSKCATVARYKRKSVEVGVFRRGSYTVSKFYCCRSPILSIDCINSQFHTLWSFKYDNSFISARTLRQRWPEGSVGCLGYITGSVPVR